NAVIQREVGPSERECVVREKGGRLAIVSRVSEGLSEDRRLEISGEQPIEIRRYAAALRRSWLFIVVFVASLTAVAVIGSRLASKHYRATATLIQGGTLIQAGSAASPDVV